MPSDPLPLSPETEAGRELLDPGTAGAFCSYIPSRAPAIIAIEQEARTLARAEVIAEAVAAVEGLEPDDIWCRKADVLAALSRLGERE